MTSGFKIDGLQFCIDHNNMLSLKMNPRLPLPKYGGTIIEGCFTLTVQETTRVVKAVECRAPFRIVWGDAILLGTPIYTGYEFITRQRGSERICAGKIMCDTEYTEVLAYLKAVEIELIRRRNKVKYATIRSKLSHMLKDFEEIQNDIQDTHSSEATELKTEINAAKKPLSKGLSSANLMIKLEEIM